MIATAKVLVNPSLIGEDMRKLPEDMANFPVPTMYGMEKSINAPPMS